MKKQRVCIIGGSLTGLVTAISLSKLNCEIDLITEKSNIKYSHNRTIAISENNFKFLNKLNISKSLKKEIWACNKMKLYSEEKNQKFSKVFELNNNKQKKIMYIIENSKIMKLMINKIKKTKSISLKYHKKISKIYNLKFLKSIKLGNDKFKYNLVIICTGGNSQLVKNIFNETVIRNSYKEISITTILNHHLFKNDTSRQIFFNDGILALLPLSNSKTSIVWIIKKNIENINEKYIKHKIKLYTKDFLKNIYFKNKIEKKDLNFIIRNKYYKARILLFGDALHVIHPFVGQGFNMVLRDLDTLENILSKKINLGLDIGSTDILSEFSRYTKPRNFAFSIGVDVLKNSFSHIKLRNTMLKISDKSEIVKNIFFNIANKGLRF